MLRTGRTGLLKGCTCLQKPVLASYSTASTSKNDGEPLAVTPEGSSKDATAPSVVYTRPQDAFDPLFADLPAAPRPWDTSSRPQSYSSSSAYPRSAAPPPNYRPTNTRPPPRAPLQQARPQQKQTLTQAEAVIFAELLNAILPNAPAGSRDGGIFGGSKTSAGNLAAEKVQEALRRKGARKSGSQARRSKAELSDREIEQLDRMREVMVGFESDLELLKWSMVEVFGFDKKLDTVFPDLAIASNLSQPPPPPPTAAASSPSATPPLPRGPASPLYPDLLLILFLLLRDTYRSPQLALHIFSLASSSPYSYVQGCHTALYNEVLRTRWMEGDVEAVAQGVDEMRSAGVRMDGKTREIVDAIGVAIRVDEERAEARVAVAKEDAEKAADPASSDSAPSNLSLKDEENLLKRYRYFGAHQARAWGKMEKAVEENQEETLLHQQRAQDERWLEAESRRARFDEAERQQAERERPNLFFGAPSRPPRSSSHYDEDAPRPARQTFDAADPSWDDASQSLPSSFFGRKGGFTDEWAQGGEAPKRPSFANPFKIRRKGMTREDKSRRDSQHPLLRR